MDICLISDNNYVDYLSSLIVSILKNSSIDDEFSFHIIEIDITEYNKKKLIELKILRILKYIFIDLKNILIKPKY